MKLSEYDKDYYAFSAKAGDVARQLAFAGIAVIWLFKIDASNATSLPKQLWWPAAAFICSLTADILHYLIQTMIWGRFAYVQRTKHGKTDDDVIPDPPSWYLWPANLLFYVKTVSVVTGFALLFHYLWGRIAFA